MTKEESNIHWKLQLRHALTSSFSLSELKIICFDLNIPYEELFRESKNETIIEIIHYCIRANRIHELIEHCKKQRPIGPWDQITEGIRVSEQSKFYNIALLSKFDVQIAEKKILFLWYALTSAVILGAVFIVAWSIFTRGEKDNNGLQQTELTLLGTPTATGFPAAPQTTSLNNTDTPTSATKVQAFAATSTPITSVRETDKMTMVYVPMGEEPFWIDQTEMTYERYLECPSQIGCKAPNLGENDSESFRAHYLVPKHPIVGVDWFSAKAYCNWVHPNGDLPTLSQWEYAAFGNENIPFPWGSEQPSQNCNPAIIANCRTMLGKNTDTAPVGSVPAGDSWVGAKDMVGNASEWVTDDREPNIPYVIGASWRTPLDHPHLQNISGASAPATAYSYEIGFRCAVTD